MTKHITKTAIEIIADTFKHLNEAYDNVEKLDKDKIHSEYIEGLRRGKRVAVKDCADFVAVGLEVVDPTFDRDRFLTQCGIRE